MYLEKEELTNGKEFEDCWNCGKDIHVGDFRQVIQEDGFSNFYCRLCEDSYEVHSSYQEPTEIPKGSERVRVKEIRIRYNDRAYRPGAELIIQSEHFDDELFEKVEV